jgi:hypothetical protein
VKKQEQGANVLDLHSSIIITGETYYNQPAIQPDDATPYDASPLVLSPSYSFTSITNSSTSHEIAQPSKDYQSPIITWINAPRRSDARNHISGAHGLPYVGITTLEELPLVDGDWDQFTDGRLGAETGGETAVNVYPGM